jgi:hypothetical protein
LSIEQLVHVELSSLRAYPSEHDVQIEDFELVTSVHEIQLANVRLLQRWHVPSMALAYPASHFPALHTTTPFETLHCWQLAGHAAQVASGSMMVRF